MICCFTVNSFLTMSLPTAGMVIGWVCAVISLFQSVIFIKANEIIEYTRSHGNEIPADLNASSTMICIVMTSSLLDFIASVVLIIGVNKRNHLFLLPWLINYGISLTIKFVFGIVLIVIILIIMADSDSPGSGLVLGVMILSILVFFGMIWNAIYSLFQSIRKANDREILDTERLIG